MQLAVAITLSVVPAGLILWYFYSHDQRPEPRHVLIITFILGVLVAIPVVGATALITAVFPARLEMPLLEALLLAFLCAAIPEQFFRLLVLLGYCCRQDAFDEPMDGVIYGVTVALGFAVLENIFYVLDRGWTVALSRAFTAVPMHACLGALLGYYVGQAHRRPGRLGDLAYGLLVVVLLHGLYDFPLLMLRELDLRGIEASPAQVIGWFTMAFSLLAVAAFSTVGILRRLRRTGRGEQERLAAAKGLLSTAPH